MEQEHIPAGMQELCSQQAGDPQKPSAQGESPQMSMAKCCPGVPEARAVPGQLQDDGGQGRVSAGAAGAGMHCRLPQQSLLSPAAVVSSTVVLLELQPAPEPEPEPEDAGEDLQQEQPQEQPQAAWKEGNLGSPASAPEPSVAQSPRREQLVPGQPCAGSQVQNWWQLPLPSLPRAGWLWAKAT